MFFSWSEPSSCQFSFCRFKHLLLTKSELIEVRKINEKAGILAVQGLDRINKYVYDSSFMTVWQITLCMCVVQCWPSPLSSHIMIGCFRQNMCKGKEGLITKIVEVMKKEPTSSTFRFWLARSVEAYLRGATSYCDQVFLLRRGLLQASDCRA